MLQVFNNEEFGRVRAVTESGKVLFCAKDVANALGYTRTTDAIKVRCKGAALYRPLATQGGMQKFRFITQPDVFRLIISSKLPNAQKFEVWVFEEVLPTIAENGAYLAPEKVEEALLDPDTIIRLATELKEERAKRMNQEAPKEVVKPKAVFDDAVNASQTSILIGDLAKILRQNGIDTGQRRLFDWMRDNGYLTAQGNDRNTPTQKSVELGVMETKESAFLNRDGSAYITRTPMVTGKGQVYFINKFLGDVEQVSTTERAAMNEEELAALKTFALSAFKTAELVNELVERDGVCEHVIEPNEYYSLVVAGPARVLVVTD